MVKAGNEGNYGYAVEPREERFGDWEHLGNRSVGKIESAAKCTAERVRLRLRTILSERVHRMAFDFGRKYESIGRWSTLEAADRRRY